MGIASPLPTVHASHASPHRARSKARSPNLDETHGPSAAHATPLHTAFAHEHPRKHPTRSWRWSGRRDLPGSTREIARLSLITCSSSMLSSSKCTSSIVFKFDLQRNCYCKHVALSEENSILLLPECLESSGWQFLKVVDNQ